MAKANFKVRLIEMGGDALVPIAPYPKKFLKPAELKEKVGRDDSPRLDELVFEHDAFAMPVGIAAQIATFPDDCRSAYFACSFCNLR